MGKVSVSPVQRRSRRGGVGSACAKRGTCTHAWHTNRRAHVKAHMAAYVGVLYVHGRGVCKPGAPHEKYRNHFSMREALDLHVCKGDVQRQQCPCIRTCSIRVIKTALRKSNSMSRALGKVQC